MNRWAEMLAGVAGDVFDAHPGLGGVTIRLHGRAQVIEVTMANPRLMKRVQVGEASIPALLLMPDLPALTVDLEFGAAA